MIFRGDVCWAELPPPTEFPNKCTALKIRKAHANLAVFGGIGTTGSTFPSCPARFLPVEKNLYLPEIMRKYMTPIVKLQPTSYWSALGKEGTSWNRETGLSNPAPLCGHGIVEPAHGATYSLSTTICLPISVCRGLMRSARRPGPSGRHEEVEQEAGGIRSHRPCVSPLLSLRSLRKPLLHLAE